MKMRWAWTLPLLSSMAVTLVASSSSAQPQAGYAVAGGMNVPMFDPAMLAQAQATAYGQSAPYPYSMMAAGYSPMPAGYGPMASYEMQGAAGPAGPPVPMPLADGSYGGMPADYGMGMPMDTGCPYCSGHGCEACRHMHGPHGPHGRSDIPGLRRGFVGNIARWILPYADGGCAAIRWYDFAVDGMYLKREDAGRNLQLTSQGVAGPIVLETNDFEFDYETSFRFSGVLQAGPGNNVEFTYFGLFHHQDRENVRSPADDLFSVFSDFGLTPIGGFPETDESDFQQITYTSTFDSFEVNFRHRWMSPNCRYQGSWLAGARHFILDEKFRYFTSSSANVNLIDPLDPGPSQLQADVDTTNNLTGIQFGGDLWVCVVPGLRLGGELKGGVYGNHMNINSTVAVNTGRPTEFERQDHNDVSFVGQADILATYRINYQWTARAGYQFLYVDGVALAPENFNTVPPFGPVDRVAFVDDDGDVFYHGYFAGMEFMW